MTDNTASLLTPRQLAEWLQLPLSTLYSWRTQGIGPPGFKVGRGIRYRRSDVEGWLEKQFDGSMNKTTAERP